MPNLYTDEQRFALKAEAMTGARIAALIEDETIQKHLNGLLHGYQNMWLDEEDPGKQCEIWRRANALKTLIESLQSVVNSGKMATAQLNLEKNDA
jgi:hypothetical protein